jgi:hypothetical protein
MYANKNISNLKIKNFKKKNLQKMFCHYSLKDFMKWMK